MGKRPIRILPIVDGMGLKPHLSHFMGFPRAAPRLPWAIFILSLRDGNLRSSGQRLREDWRSRKGFRGAEAIAWRGMLVPMFAIAMRGLRISDFSKMPAAVAAILEGLVQFPDGGFYVEP
jgi:hypothetical protein